MSDVKPLTKPLADAPLIRDWIRFAQPGQVDVMTGRVELGQGNLTAILQLAADELDVDPACVRVTSGDTTQTPNEGFTSGSLSISQGGMSVRHAASAARHVLLGEAGRLLQCPPADLAIENGRVMRGGEATTLDLWRLAEVADLTQPVAAWTSPKTPGERRVVGRALPRIDLVERITGTPFVHDLDMPGMLHGRPVHPPNMRSRLVKLDMAELEARPGVVAVAHDGSFVGVIAQDAPRAIRAALWAANRAQWSAPQDAPGDVIAAIGASQESLDIVHEVGDVSAVDGRSFETTVSRPYLCHGSIGPAAAVALWQDERLQVWTHSQGVYPLRGALAAVFGIDVESIEVRHRMGAGCYGHNGADDVALDAALMARAVPGRPVKVVWSRADEFQCAPLGPGMTTSVRAVLDGDSRIAAMDVTVNSAPHGNRPGRNGAPNLRASAYLADPFAIPRSRDIPLANGGGAERNAVSGYAIPNSRVGKRLVHELPFRTSSLRSLGGFTNVYAIETMMDEIAADIGEDPISFRLRHLDDERARAVIERAVEEAGRPFDREREEGVGWGLGYARYKNTAAWCAVLARIELAEEVRVRDVYAALDAGEIVNPDGAINQTEGGILQAISWTLHEAVRFEDDHVATASWLDYPILTFEQVPNVHVSLIDRPDQPPLGCAEGAQGPTAAALGNALRDAMGVVVRDLPLNRDAIIRALG